MSSVAKTPTYIAVLLLILLMLVDTNAKPWTQHTDPVGFPSTTVVCTEQIANLCQQCAKKTKSQLVYPWCCEDIEGAREWCDNYLYFGLP